MIIKTKKDNPLHNPNTGKILMTEAIGESLATLLAEKISSIYPEFKGKEFVKIVAKDIVGLSYTKRIEVLAKQLKEFLPSNYQNSLEILMQILGPENPNETGMFR